MSRLSDSDRVRRLARVLTSDIVAYAGDQVRICIEKDDLFDRLRPEIERAHDYYVQQVDPAMSGSERIFNHAVVDVLVVSQRRVPSSIW